MTVTQSYIDGIKEGRSYMREYAPSREDVVSIMDNLKSTMKAFSAGPVKDLLKGELDFWKGQAHA